MANQFGDGQDTPSGVRARAARYTDPAAAKLLEVVDDPTIAAAISAVRDLLRRWAQVPPGGTLTLGWPLRG